MLAGSVFSRARGAAYIRSRWSGMSGFHPNRRGVAAIPARRPFVAVCCFIIVVGIATPSGAARPLRDLNSPRPPPAARRSHCYVAQAPVPPRGRRRAHTKHPKRALPRNNPPEQGSEQNQMVVIQPERAFGEAGIRPAPPHIVECYSWWHRHSCPSLVLLCYLISRVGSGTAGMPSHSRPR